MKRRQLLSLFGAAAVAPALPSMAGGRAAVAGAAAGYNRYMYGLAVFHARTRAGLTQRDLMVRLGVGPVQARAMMSEMTARGVFSGLSGTVARSSAPRPAYVRKALRKLNQSTPNAAAPSDHARRPSPTDTFDVQRDHRPSNPTPETTSRGSETAGDPKHG